MTHAVELQNVTKTFGRQKAVDDLSLAVPAGSVYGFIGPNGSGKTTTLRLIMRNIYPEQGANRVFVDELELAAAMAGHVTGPVHTDTRAQPARDGRVA